MEKALDSLKKPAIAAVFLGLLLFYGPSVALAASGGRIGGSNFSSRSSSSSSSSRSYSVPRSSSYSESYYGGGSGYVSTTDDDEYLAIFFIILVVSSPVVLVYRLVTDLSQDDILLDTQKTSVLKLQVGLLGSWKTIQQDFNSLAEIADTSTSKGLSYVLTEATLALLRHREYCISCYSLVNVKRNIEEGEKRFNQLSIHEREKFDEETLVNVDNIKRQSSKMQSARDSINKYIVVTILVAAEGIHNLQPINGRADLKKALQKLGSIP